MREKIVAGNWKMNNDAGESSLLVSGILKLTSPEMLKNCSVILFPSFTSLSLVAQLLQEQKSHVKVGAQNCHWAEKGAFTGEISAKMLRSEGAEYVLIGHSERRQYAMEDNKMLSEKIKTALSIGLKVIYCCGESLTERESDQHFSIVEKQIVEGLKHLKSSDYKKIIIAYEPVWAIGTGKTASTLQAQEMHSFIRHLIEKNFGAELASAIPILYGGSCNATNAAALFSQKDIDGGLIGGASLKAEEFISIIKSFS